MTAYALGAVTAPCLYLLAAAVLSARREWWERRGRQIEAVLRRP